MDEKKRKHIEKQIEQIDQFLENCYDCYCHDVKITWKIGECYDPIKQTVHKPYSADSFADYLKRKGKHKQISVGFGDLYYGSSSLGHMITEAAVEWREKLQGQLDNFGQKSPVRTFADIES